MECNCYMKNKWAKSTREDGLLIRLKNMWFVFRITNVLLCESNYISITLSKWYSVLWIQPQMVSPWFHNGCDVYSDHTRINKIFNEDSRLPGCTAACWMSDSYRLRSNGLGLTYSVNECIGSVKTLVTIYDSTGYKTAKALRLYQHRSDKFKYREKFEVLKLRMVCCASEHVWTLSLRRIV